MTPLAQRTGTGRQGAAGARPVAVALLLAAGAVAAWAASGASARALIEGWTWQLSAGAVLASGDLTGDGRDELVVADGERLNLYASGSLGRWVPMGEIGPLPSRVTAVGVADVTGDGRGEVLVGAERGGALYVYQGRNLSWDGQRWVPGVWVPLGRTRHLWSPVLSLTAGRVTGAGWSDVVAVTAAGEVFLLSLEDSGWEERWRWPETMGQARAAAVGDLTGDGRAEVAVALAQDHVSVWGWQEAGLGLVWQAYPWGQITGLSLADVDQDSLPEVLLTTSEQILYAFGVSSQGGSLRFGQKLHLPGPGYFPLQALAAADLTADGRPELLGGGRGGLVLVSPHENAILWHGAAFGPIRQVELPRGAPPLALADGGTLYGLEVVPASRFRLEADGRVWRLADVPLVRWGVPFLSTRDWAELFGLTIYWDGERHRATLLGREGYLIVTADQREAIWSGRLVAFGLPPELASGRLFLPVDVAALFGMRASFNERRRELFLERTGEAGGR